SLRWPVPWAKKDFFLPSRASTLVSISFRSFATVAAPFFGVSSGWPQRCVPRAPGLRVCPYSLTRESGPDIHSPTLVFLRSGEPGEMCRLLAAGSPGERGAEARDRPPRTRGPSPVPGRGYFLSFAAPGGGAASNPIKDCASR